MKNVYLVQASIDHGHDTSGWIPYAAGCIWSYAYQHDFVKENFVLKDIIFRREKHSDILDRMEEPVVVGFSCYVWNANYSLRLAEEIKKKWPNCVIVFGGPNTGSYMTQYSFIDSIIIAEGELPFTQLLKDISENKPVELFYRDKMANLEIPSPYLTGVFDDIIKRNPDLEWWMVMESTRGCPYSCTFCDWGGVNTKVRKFNNDKIVAEIDWAVNNNVVVLIMPDANFGIFKQRDIEIAKILRAAGDNPKSKIQQIQFTYAKNTNDVCFEIDKILGPYSYGLTVSVQSMTQKTLEVIKRSIMKMNDLEYVFGLAKKHQTRTYTELILGLPEETKEDFKTGITKLLELGQHDQVQVWLATIIPNAEMADMNYRQKYGMKTRKVKVYKDNAFEGSCEETEYVVTTNSMPFDDLIESYMYAWTVLNFHHTGFSELLSKYCRNVKNMSYREFYDRLFEYVPNDPVVGPIFTHYRDTVIEYLSTGDSTGSARYLISLDCEIESHFKHKDDFINAAVAAVKEFISEDIVNLQRIFTVESTYTYPMNIEAGINIETWIEEPTSYSVGLPIKVENSNESFYDLSSQKFLKKHIFTIK